MASVKRSLRGIKTLNALVDQRRSRTSGGALMELSVMANEKVRLELELDRWRRRHAEITARLAEIAERESRLFEFVEKPAPIAPAAAAGGSQRLPEAPVAPVAIVSVNGQRLRATELSY